MGGGDKRNIVNSQYRIRTDVSDNVFLGTLKFCCFSFSLTLACYHRADK